jgi:hypothetical protein
MSVNILRYISPIKQVMNETSTLYFIFFIHKYNKNNNEKNE